MSNFQPEKSDFFIFQPKALPLGWDIKGFQPFANKSFLHQISNLAHHYALKAQNNPAQRKA